MINFPINDKERKVIDEELKTAGYKAGEGTVAVDVISREINYKITLLIGRKTADPRTDLSKLKDRIGMKLQGDFCKLWKFKVNFN